MFPAVLMLYPLMKTGRGVNVTDTTYSLANFQFFEGMDGTWIVATFLANAAGSLLMRLPFGNTLAGMYFYTLLVQSLTALAAYAALRKKIPAPLVFAGEWIALGLCWCPSTILYNYLTYLFMTAGALLLYAGVLKDDRRYDAAAGICLGLNVAVRMPNIVQAAFIVVLWYGAAVRRRAFKKVLQDTLCCVLGYLIGFGAPFAAICLRYGTRAYPDMVRTMFAMTDKAVDYKPAAMITGMFGDYITGMYRLIFAGICMAGGWVMFAVQRKVFAGNRAIKALCVAVYVAVLLVLVRFYWGQGVFSFHYYSDGSVYHCAVLFLTVSVFAALYCLLGKAVSYEQKVLALLVLVQILITPLGSNNDLYPMINNLFITAPFVLRTAYGRHGQEHGADAALPDRESYAVVWRTPFVLLAVLVLIQSTGFHMSYAFRDGDDGTARDTVLSLPAKAAGIRTTSDNAACLEELAGYMADSSLTGKRAVMYGDIPGLSYLLDMPPALSTFWPDLDSYTMAKYERDMAQLSDPPVVILASDVAAYLNGDADGMNWFGTDRDRLDRDEKLQILIGYMDAHAYRESFANGRYAVYVTE